MSDSEAEEKPEREKVLVQFRTYAHGEVVALLPEHAGCPEGLRCVSIIFGGTPMSVDHETVMHTTRPAEPKEYARLKRALEREPYNYDLTLVQDVEQDVHDSRKERGDEYGKHPHIRRLFHPKQGTGHPVHEHPGGAIHNPIPREEPTGELVLNTVYPLDPLDPVDKLEGGGEA